MRVSNFPLLTQKETPAEAEIISHQLMLRAGMIRKLASGLYTWLPLGLRVLQKVEDIVRSEMNRADALEVLMPAVQPAELWQESKRWDQYGPELLRLTDRHERSFCFGPTHEEVITDLVRNELRSYKQLPINLYQIQTKFRDEIRPRFGVMRAREFIMKDAYSFHENDDCLANTYQQMFQTYCNIFNRIGLEYRPVEADNGSIGGNQSHEFHVLADSGEDAIAFSTEGDYAANVELAPTQPLDTEPSTELLSVEKVETPGKKSIAAVTEFLGIQASDCIKTLVVKGSEEDGLVALIVRGDHELNTIKAEKIPEVASPLEFASDKEIVDTLKSKPGYIGPVNLDCKIIVDYAAAASTNFVCGANESGMHYKNVNWRDIANITQADLRQVVEGDPSPDGKGTLRIQRGIEVGHIFQLGQKYSQEMNAAVLNKDGKEQTLTMGCYGIGITRIVAAAIEQHNDEKGIIWPNAIAPFQVSLIPINMHKSEMLLMQCTKLYEQLSEAGIEVLWDDRNARAGAMFADHELIGIPHRIVLSDRSLEEGNVEYKGRTDESPQHLPLSSIMDFLQDKLN